MTTPFGPQLVGETEKALGALLDRFLDGTGLTEREWVTMRLAHQAGATDLAEAVATRARFADAPALVQGLADRGLLDGGEPTTAGRELTALVQARITAATSAIWEGLPEQDVAAATRVLNEVCGRARDVLAMLS